MSDPLVSIVMGVRNEGDKLPAALRSLEEQSYSNWELVVCNDASTDDTRTILKQFQRRLGPGKVKILENSEQRWLAASLNRCLAEASGDFIARMDADDMCVPERLETQMRYLQGNAEIDLVGSAMQRFDDSGLKDVLMPMNLEPTREWFRRTLRTPFAHATIVARRRVFDELGGYTVAWRTRRCEDVDLWYRFFAEGMRGKNIDQPLYLVREDNSAIRRRTPTSRLQGFFTRTRGNWLLGAAPSAYILSLMELSKAVVPYPLIQLYRRRQSAHRVTSSTLPDSVGGES